VAYKIAAGELEPEPGVRFEAGKLGEREIGEKSIVITGPPVTFTKQNIDEFDF
jgi:rhamnose transport system substrate-binding protein